MAFDGNKILVHNGSEQPDILESYGSLSHELRSEYRSKQIKAAERAKWTLQANERKDKRVIQ